MEVSVQRTTLWVLLVSAVLISLTSQALAISSRGATRIEQVPAGTEWIAGHGEVFPSTSRALVSKTFAQRYGSQWSERRHGPLGAFRTIWGEGIPAPAEVMDDPAAALEVARAFLSDNSSLFPAGVSPADLEPWANEVAAGARLVSFHQLVDGVPLLEASAFVAFKQARLVMVGLRLFPASPVQGQPRLDAAGASALALQALRARGIEAQVEDSAPARFPRLGGDRVTAIPIFAVQLRAPRAGRWTAYVDTVKGELLALRDERLFAGANLHLEHHDRNPAGGLVESPAAYLQVGTSGGATYADVDGFLNTGSGEIDLEIQGRYARVVNLAGAEISARVAPLQEGSSYVWHSDGSEQQMAQLDAYRFVTEARDHAKALSPDVSWIDEVLRVNVNYDDVCNAWFDGELTFLQAGEYMGSRCANSAMIADIVYHEFGHGFHMASGVGGFYSMDEAVSEGFADYVSASITNDPALAPGFEERGGVLRDLRPDKVWPDDSGNDPHVTGLIVGGALWDLRVLLMDELGALEGAAVADAIFAGAMRTTSDVPSLYEAALLADDDNGNLNDGTPHLCTIDAAFAPHGLKAGMVSPLTISHAPLARLAPDTPVAIEVEVAATNTQCSNALVGNARLVYSIDAGLSWKQAELRRGDDGRFSGELPGAPVNSQLLYRIEVDEPLSEALVTRPANPAEPYFTAFVGTLEEIHCDDLETETPDWNHRLIAGRSSEGADDWQRATPGGAGGDPSAAYSGSFVWGNDLAPESSWNGTYQANKRNALTGPVWEVGEHEQVRLQFRRWLTVEDGRYDVARVYVNDEMVWHNLIGDGDQHHVDREWVLFDLDISAQVAATGSAQVTWELESDDGKEFGGWTIDDVCLQAVVAPAVEPDPTEVGAAGDDKDGTPGRLLGCGCAQSTGGAGAAALLPLLALFLLRRRCR